MNTKKAIEFVKNQKYSIEALKNIYRLDNNMTSAEEKSYLESLTRNKEFGEIITLLKRGEKHKDMWEELYVVFGNNIIDDIASLTDVMEQLEQKYFPKGG